MSCAALAARLTPLQMDARPDNWRNAPDDFGVQHDFP